MKKTWRAAAVAVVLGVTGPALADSITAEEVAAAQQAWADGIVMIGKVYTDKGDYKAAAKKHLDTLYAYELGPVLFKPTKAAEDQFRETEEQAMSYFVGGMEHEDHGFAINPWTKVRFENHNTITDDDSATAMGNYFFTDTSGKETKVEYTFGYIKDSEGHLRINVHHSSLPYKPAH